MHDRTAGASENRPEAEETGVERAPAMSSKGPETRNYYKMAEQLAPIF